MSLNKQTIFTFALLLFTIIFFGTTDIDTLLQNHFFQFDTNKWVLDRNLEPYKLIFYDGVKRVLILFAILLLIVLLFFRKKETLQKYKKGIIIVLLSSILIPITVGGLKRYTNMPCPKHEKIYGGVYPKTKVWEAYPPKFRQADKIKCWPAGHASGGFALLSLFFLFKRRRNKILSLIVASMIGTSMGLYKMLIGDHYLSHTLITLLLSWLIILLIVRSVNNSSQI